MNSSPSIFSSKPCAGRRLLSLALFGFALASLAPSARAQLYSQDFSGGSAPGWVVVAGAWTVNNGYYWDTDWDWQDISYYSGATFDTGFTYTASITLYGNGTGNDSGLVYNYQNSSNFYEVELNGETDTAYLEEYVNTPSSSTGTIVATASFTPSGGDYQTVAVVRSGTTTTIQVNGATVITQTETALTGGGYIGVGDQFGDERITNITVTDTGAPTVAITAPGANAQVSGTTAVTASASDGYGIATVQFQLDGTNLGSAVTSAPYTVNWDTTAATNGTHTLTAIATNVGGAQTTSAPVAVTVSNSINGSQGPLYSQDFSGGSAPGWVVVAGAWTVNNGYYWDTDWDWQDISYYSGATFDTGFTYTASITLYGNGTGNDSGLVYNYQNSSNFYEVELNGETDTAYLEEYVNTPSSSTGTIVATASFTPSGGDYQTVAVVRSGTTTTIQVNGATVITRTETALTGGGYIGVGDQFGDERITNITVTDTGSPAVAITAPSANAQVSGTTAVTASASDGYGIASVQFQLDGVNLGSAVTSAPYTTNWDTTAATNGTHTLTAIATNVGGIQTTSSPITVTVNDGGGGGSLPTGWSNEDIGDPGTAGSASYSNGTYTVQGSGNGMWGTAGSFQYAYTQMTGNGTIVAHVESESAAGDSGWEHGGVMISDALSAGSTYAAMYSCTNGLSWEARTTANETPTEEKYTTTTTNPYWIALVRSGNNFTAYSSSNGTTWTQYGSTLSITMGSTVYVGLAVSSENQDEDTTAVFDNVSVEAGPTVAITAPSSGSDVSGTVAVTASASSGPGIASVQFQLDGTNLGSAITSSPYTYSWNTVNVSSGQHTLTAIATDSLNNQATSAPVNVTVTVADQTPPTVSITAPSNNAQVSGTVAVSANASDNVAVASVQFQLDGVNLGSAVTTAPYTISWDTTTASNGSHTLTAIATDTSNNQATSSAVTVTVNNSGALPTGWGNQDIGSPGAAGSSSYSDGTYTVSGGGTGIYNTSDEFQFAYQQVTGDCSIVAQVDSVAPVGDSGWEHGGIMIRDTLDADSAYAGAYETASRGLLFEDRTSTGASATGVNDGTHLTPYWVKLTRNGNVFTAYSSPDGSTWTELGSPVTISMGSTAYAGLAVSSEINDTPTTAVFENVSITSDQNPPTVSITAPADQSQVSGTVTVSADASGSNGIASVQFQLDGANLGAAVTSSPYTYSWDTTTASNAQHVLTAIATDSLGYQTVSDGVIVTVSNGGSGGQYKTNFPKLGEIAYNQGYDSTAWQQDIAKFDLAILNFYNGWNKSGLTIQQAVEDIKSYNPSILLGNYTLLESCPPSSNAATLPEYDELADQVGPTGNGGTWTPNDWFAHDTSGANPDEGDYLVANITAFVTPDSNGDRFPQWYAKWEDSWCFSTTPQFDFIYSDNSFYEPRVDADWNRSGTDASNTDPTVQAYYRQGMASYWAELNQLEPKMFIMGNPDGNSASGVGYLRDPEYQYKIGSAVYEGAMGQSWSEENYAGWYLMMESYQTLLANTAAPNIVLVENAMTSDGLAYDTAIQGNYAGGNPYAFMRYALASTLMNNGYFEADPGYAQNPAFWFDEYDLAGTATTSWLGAPVDPPQTEPYQNGVWMRRFQNGMALVNPRTQANLVDGSPVNNSTETVTIPSGYAHFQGTQDPTTNNGQPVTSITLQPGDGVLLVKQQ